jgi:hypothetical protein
MEVLGALFGMPMFSYLLLRSKKAQTRGQVSWKGRAYSIGTRSENIPEVIPSAKPSSRIENQGLRAKG